jgi:dihydroneopterin aldolase
VFLRDIVTEAQVGLHPWERHAERPTRLIVNVDMFGRPGEFLDYDRIREAIRGWPLRPHTPLLETLAEELVALCLEDARVQSCRVSVAKPDIFNEAAAAGVEIVRRRRGPA